MTFCRQGTKEQAFTLIELLVVVAIIALLISILLPSLSQARMQARRVASASNMRHIGMAMDMYAEDWNGAAPMITHSLQEDQKYLSWIFQLRPYFGGGRAAASQQEAQRYRADKLDELRICPADPFGDERLAARSTSYTLNDYIALDQVDPFGRVIAEASGLHQLRQPSDTPTVFIRADPASGAHDFSTDDDHVHARDNWFRFAPEMGLSWPAIRADIQPDRFASGSKRSDGTSGSSLFLYADTHVDPIQATKIRAWADEGFNFAAPLEARQATQP